MPKHRFSCNSEAKGTSYKMFHRIPASIEISIKLGFVASRKEEEARAGAPPPPREEDRSSEQQL
jgi:hypothetical protein